MNEAPESQAATPKAKSRWLGLRQLERQKKTQSAQTAPWTFLI